MTRLFKRSSFQLIRLGGAKASTHGSISGRPELDLVSLFKQA